MKKLAILLFISSLVASCMSSKDQFKITGQVAGVDTGLVFLQKYNQEKWVNVDSAKLEKGSFSFAGKLGLPEMCHIAIQNSEVLVPVFIENATIEVSIFPDSLDKTVVKGSQSHETYKQYLAMNEAINVKMDSIYMEWKKAKEVSDTIGMARFDSISNSLDADMKGQLQSFVKTNNTTVVSPYLVMRNSWQFELAELEEIVSVMDTAMNGSQYMQALLKRVEILKSVSIGQIAPDFEMADSTGNMIRLSSLKGKILLVDFWASWCSPCRAENPNVVKAYEAYKAKGFEILGCSFDQNRDKWIKAVKEDRLFWTNVSDLKGWSNAAGKLYGINSIPANVLLDKDQKIIGRNLRGEDLLKKLEEVLGPPAVAKKLKGK